MTIPARTRSSAARMLQGEALGSVVAARLVAAFPRLRHGDAEAWPGVLPSLGLADLAPWLRFEKDRYTRVLLATDGEAEALLMGWLPGHESPIHGHGASCGVARVLAGGGTEQRFEVRDGKAVPTGETRISAGDVLVERSGDVHRVQNASGGLLVTLHVYAPRLVDPTTYEAEGNP